ncbi:MAG: flotillin family protein [Proteobacteria bacterium]|nr:flotillin family protein [Cystobacterineae bacterium]MCL2258516.1 flotillin family protein [Cystobacterineae bacterium]MCL2315255.1 flotillin family protein [Pseudomonadota bacterium]
MNLFDQYSLELLFLAGVVLVAIFAIGFILSRLYTRSTKEMAFVRTGMGGQKVIMDGGALVLPVLHDICRVNMNTLRLEVSRAKSESLIAKDRMRVDVIAAFYVRVQPTAEAIAAAAQTLGLRTLEPLKLKELVEDKFVDALRATAATMTMQQLQDARQDFVQGVQNSVSEDILKNGLELESVSLTSLDQTAKDYFNPNNAFDAEGLTKLTEETERRRKERNAIEQDTEVGVRQKNLGAEQEKLEIERRQEFLRLDQQRQIETQRAEQVAQIAQQQAERQREAEQAKILAQQEIDQSRLVAERQVKATEAEKEQTVRQRQITAEREIRISQIDQEKVSMLAAQDKEISISVKSREQSEAERLANEARAEAARAEESVKTAREVAIAEREKAVALVEAQQHAQKQAIGITVAAQAEKNAAADQAEAVRIKAEAQSLAYKVEAEGKRLVNDAINTLRDAQIALQVKLALIERLPQIIEQSVKPMEAIEGIKIIQVEGLGGASRSGGAGGENATGGGNLADQAANAMLRYRAQQPVIDALLSEIGIRGGDINGIISSALPDSNLPPSPSPSSPSSTASLPPTPPVPPLCTETSTTPSRPLVSATEVPKSGASSPSPRPAAIPPLSTPPFRR